MFAQAFRNQGLDPFGQVHVVGKIKSAVILKLLDHINEWLVVRVDTWVAGIVNRNKKQLFNSKNVALQQAAN